MKNTWFIGLLTITLSIPAFAQSVSSKPETSVSFGLGTAGSKFHFGPGFHIEFPTKIDGKSFKFGGQTGLLFGPSSPTTWIIPILFGGTYMIPANSELKPYIGLSMGAGIARVNKSSYRTFLGTVESPSATNVDFALLFKPGVKLGEGHKFFAELPFGTLGSDFAILPTVGYSF